MKRILVRASLFFVVLVFTFGMSSVFAESISGNPAHTLGSITDPAPGAMDGVAPASNDDPEYRPNEVLVMFRTDKNLKNTDGGRKSVKNIVGNTSGEISVNKIWSFKTEDGIVSGGKKKIDRRAYRNKSYSGIALIKSSKYSADKLISMFKSRPDVLYVEKNYKVHALGVTDDTYSDFQWSMLGGDNTPNVSAQWPKGENEENIVAVLDTGIDYDHPDLQDNLWDNDQYPRLKGDCGYNFIKATEDPYDDNGHGTHVAGIIGAVGDNQEGISGVNRGIKIMSLKTLDKDGSAYMSHEIDAYNYIDIALDMGEHVRAINNSWGGGEYSYIFEELVNIVGEKGAITICAAGNDGTDNDKNPDYPSCIDSPYIVTVAATDIRGEMAEYSNYGEETVDVAAPGSEILSTIPYSSYNPTLYINDPEKKDKYNQSFNDFENDSEKWGIPYEGEDAGKIYVNGIEYNKYKSDGGKAKIISGEDKGFLNSKKSMHFEMKNLEEDDLVCITVPYTIDEAAQESQVFSMVGRASGPEDSGDMFGGPIFCISEVPAGEDTKSLDFISERSIVGQFIDGESNTYSHFEFQCPSEDDDLQDIVDDAKENPDVLKREALIMVYAYDGGDYSCSIDDIGMSKPIKAGEFEKYDFMSGTSMAAPYFSGAIALKAAELDKTAEGGKTDVETLINETVSSAKDTILEPHRINQGGALDFTKSHTGNLPPRLGRIAVDTNKNEIIIKGSGLNDPKKVEIGTYDEHGNDDLDDVTSKVKSSADKQIILENDGWINNIRTIRVTREINGKEKSSIRRDVYLVKGKKAFTMLPERFNAPYAHSMTTDGKQVYWTDTVNGAIGVTTIEKDKSYVNQYCEIDPVELFGSKNKKNVEYGMIMGDDLATIDGKVYTVIEYGQLHTGEDESEFWIEFSKGNHSYADGFALNDEAAEGPQGIYSGELRLVGVMENEMEELEAINLGKLPVELEKTADWTMTSYNGKLYFMGGYSYNKNNKGVTDAVYSYDPATKKWNKEKAALAKPRAGGKAIQSGNNIVYTMGYPKYDGEVPPVEEQAYPPNLVFDGKKWTEKTATIEPYWLEKTVVRKGKEYLCNGGSIGLIKGGIAYMGSPVLDYGDTFTYDIKKDEFKDTGYNFIDMIEAPEMNGIVVGPNLYGYFEGDTYRINVPSGLVSVSVSKTANGSISGNGGYMPGTTVKSTVKARKNFRIKTLKLNGKKVKLAKNTTSKVLTMKNITEDQYIGAAYEKYKFKVKVKKKGKGKVTGGKTYIKGKTATIKVKAAKGYYIKSIKQGKKKIKVKKNATSKKFKIKKIKKDWKVTVVFAKKKK